MPTVTSNLVIRLKDELTPAAKQASKALQGIQKAEGDLQKQAEKLAKATDSLGNLQKLNKSLATTTAEFNKQRATLKDLGQQILNTDGPNKKLQEAFRRTEQVMEQTRKSMEKQQKAAASMAKSFQEASGSPFRNFHSAEEQMRRDIESTTKAISAQHRASTNLIEGQERAARRRKRISNTFSGVGALAGPVVLHGADEAYKAGAELQHRRVEMTKAGMGPMVGEIEQQALKLALQFKNVTQSEIMEMGKEIRSVLSKPEEVAHVLPAIVAARSVLDARDPSGGESQALGLLVKGSEVLGAGQDPERLIKLVDGFTRAMQVMGKTINPEEVYDFAKNSRLSGARFSDRFLLTTAMSTLQELGGASSGKAANEAVGQLSAAGLGKRTGAVKLLTDLGLIAKGDVVYNNTGEVSRARKGVLHPVRGDNLLATDPDKFLYDVLLPAMEQHGITKLDDQIAAIRQIFSGSKGAQDLFGKLITQRESYAAHAAMYPQASGIAGAAQNKNDPLAAMSEVSKSLETFMGVLTSPMMLPAAHGLDALATGITKITEAYAGFAKEHPDLAMAAGTAGLAGTAAAGLKLTYNLFDKVFGDGDLKGAAAAQTQASTTLMSAAKELEIAAGRLGGGGAIPGAGGGSPGTASGGGKARGLGLGRVLPFAFGLPGLALSAPDIGEVGDAARKSNYDKLEGLGQGLRHLLGLDKLSDAIFGPATKAIENKLMNSTMPADAAERMRERNELIEQENQKTRDSVWQFGQLNTSLLTLKASFDGLSQNVGGLGGGAVGGGASGGLINASFETGSISGGGSAGSGDAVSLAERLIGSNGRQAANALRSKMTPGEWCADFVNGVLKGAGGKGVNSSMARAFNTWGKAVALNDAKRGDVILERHGNHIGHVGMATGRVMRDASGHISAVEMVSGNYGHAVRKNWESIGKIGGLRRGNDAEAMPKKAPRAPGGAIEARARPAYSPNITVHVANTEGMDHRRLGDRIAEQLHKHYEDSLGASYADTGFA